MYLALPQTRLLCVRTHSTKRSLERQTPVQTSQPCPPMGQLPLQPLGPEVNARLFNNHRHKTYVRNCKRHTIIGGEIDKIMLVLIFFYLSTLHSSILYIPDRQLSKQLTVLSVICLTYKVCQVCLPEHPGLGHVPS